MKTLVVLLLFAASAALGQKVPDTNSSAVVGGRGVVTNGGPPIDAYLWDGEKWVDVMTVLKARDAEIARLKRQLAAARKREAQLPHFCPPDTMCTAMSPKGKGSR